MQSIQHRRVLVSFAVRAMVAAAVVAVAVCAPAEASGTAATPAKPAPVVGVFTGQMANGVPVYRLPTITVQASRKAEMAKMEMESKRAADGTPPRHVSESVHVALRRTAVR